MGTLALVSFLLAYKTIGDLDFWWHLAAGRWMWENKQIVSQDLFSYTAYGLPWLSITWGYEVIIYLLSFKMEWVTAFHALLAATTVVFSWLTWEHLAPRGRSQIERLIGMVVFLAGLTLVEIRWINRPEMFTHLCGAIILYLLVARDRFSHRWLYAIPFVQLLWVNTHGIFMFGPILVGLFLASDWIQYRKWKSLAPILGLTLLACLLNPRGWEGAIWPLHLLQVLKDPFFQRTIPEATNPFRDAIWRYDTWGLAVWGALLAAPVVISVFQVRLPALARRYTWAYFALAPALFWTSVNARRNIALMVIWTLPFVADIVSGLVLTRGASWIRSLNRRRISIAILTGSLPLIVSALVATNLYRSPYSSVRFGGEVTPYSFPEGARDYLEKLKKETRYQGEIFANVEFSDYMLFRLPGYRPYIDGRFAEVYPVEHFKRYMDILAHPQLLSEEASRRSIEIVGMSHNGPMSKGVISHLAQHPEWRIGYYDENAIVFLKKNRFPEQKKSDVAESDPAPLERLASQHQKAQWELSWRERMNLRHWEYDIPRPFAQLALVQAMIGDVDSALKSTKHALVRNPRHAEALNAQCAIQYLSKANTEAVEAACQEALRVGASHSSAHQILGLTYLSTQRVRQAIQSFEKVVQADPTSFEGNLMLAHSYAAMGGDPKYMDLAGRTFQEAARLRPYEPEPVIQMGLLAQSLGRFHESKNFFEVAGQMDPSNRLVSSKLAELKLQMESTSQPRVPAGK